MRKTILMSLLGLFLLAGSAAAVAPDVVAAPAADEVVLPELCPTEDAEAAPEAAPEVPSETPEPIFLCRTGDCSNDEQCQKWLKSPWAQCVKQSGQTCGHCVEA